MTSVDFIMIGIIIMIIVGTVGSCMIRNKEEKKAADWVKKTREVVDAELKKPPYIIEFRTDPKSNLITNESVPYTARMHYWDSADYHTAREIALDELNKSYRRGYFIDKSGITYPTCNVLWAKVKESDNV